MFTQSVFVAIYLETEPIQQRNVIHAKYDVTDAAHNEC